MRVCRVRVHLVRLAALMDPNGPFIAQSPAENPEPNTVGKVEGNTMLPFAGMTFSRKGKVRRVFQSQPIGQTLFPRPLSMQCP